MMAWGFLSTVGDIVISVFGKYDGLMGLVGYRIFNLQSHPTRKEEAQVEVVGKRGLGRQQTAWYLNQLLGTQTGMGLKGGLQRWKVGQG